MQIVWPLLELTSQENAGEKRASITWDNRNQQSFDELKHLCTTVSILTYANFTEPFKLNTNACWSGLGAVLYQTHDDGTDSIISYASRSLTKAEIYYPANTLEFLTLMWTVVDKFHEYLYGLTFDIYTNNNPLMYILTTANLDTMSHCQEDSLENYNFQLYYRAGKTNINADDLLRVSWPMCILDASGMHHWVTAAAVWAMQEATLKGPTSPIKAYSCDLHVMDLAEDGM